MSDTQDLPPPPFTTRDNFSPVPGGLPNQKMDPRFEVPPREFRYLNPNWPGVTYQPPQEASYTPQQPSRLQQLANWWNTLGQRAPTMQQMWDRANTFGGGFVGTPEAVSGKGIAGILHGLNVETPGYPALQPTEAYAKHLEDYHGKYQLWRGAADIYDKVAQIWDAFNNGMPHTAEWTEYINNLQRNWKQLREMGIKQFGYDVTDGEPIDRMMQAAEQGEIPWSDLFGRQR